jgi:hypothetical protein
MPEDDDTFRLGNDIDLWNFAIDFHEDSFLETFCKKSTFPHIYNVWWNHDTMIIEWLHYKSTATKIERYPIQEFKDWINSL